jgi:hypothetical protein
MNPTFKAHVIRYLAAMNATAFDSAVTSVSAYFGVAGVHAAIDSVPALTLQQGAGVLLLAFGRGLISYLSAHPISDFFQLQPATETPAVPAATATTQPK